MRKVLYILGQLHDRDVEWLARNGARRQLDDGTVLIHEGEPLDALFILLEGHLDVTAAGVGSVARLSPGEMVGEMSFVDSAPPSATVRANGGCTILEIRRRELGEKLARDDAFGHRFYRALAMFLADRLRGTVQRLGYGEDGDLASDAVLEDELDEGVLDQVSLAGERFDRMLRILAAS